MDMGLNGARIVITAGAAGIGREIARAFRGEGASVCVCDIDDEALAAIGDDGIHAVRCDVADRAALTA